MDEETRVRLRNMIELVPETAKYADEARAMLLESGAMAIYTDKQWKPAHVWLLNTGCVFASRKAKVSFTQGVSHRLTFERFCPADGTAVSDVKDTSDLQNCIKLKTAEGSLFLHTDTTETKALWLARLAETIQEALALRNQTSRMAVGSARPAHSRACRGESV